jgi:hypothetical protein
VWHPPKLPAASNDPAPKYGGLRQHVLFLLLLPILVQSACTSLGIVSRGREGSFYHWYYWADTSLHAYEILEGRAKSICPDEWVESYVRDSRTAYIPLNRYQLPEGYDVYGVEGELVDLVCVTEASIDISQEEDRRYPGTPMVLVVTYTDWEGYDHILSRIMKPFRYQEETEEMRAERVKQTTREGLIRNEAIK